LQGNERDVTKYIELAKKNMPEGSKSDIREKDIMTTLKKVSGDE